MGVRVFSMGMVFLLNLTILYAQNNSKPTQLQFDQIRDSILKYTASDTTKAIYWSNAYRMKGQLEIEPEKEWLGIESVGLTYLRNGHLPQAQKQFDKMLAFAEKNNLPSYRIRSYGFGASVQLRIQNSSKTLEFYEKGLEIAEEIENERWIEAMNAGISGVLQMTGDVERAIFFNKKSLIRYKNRPLDSVFTDSVKRLSLGSINLAIANSYLVAEEIDSATYYLNEVERYVSKDDNCQSKMLLLRKGELSLLRKDFKGARELLSDGKSIECALQTKNVNLRYAYLLGKAELGDKKYKTSRDVLLDGLEAYNVTESEEAYMVDYYKLLAQSFKELGDYEQANRYFEKYIHTTNQFKEIEDGIISTVQKQELKEFQDEVASLKQEKQLQRFYLLGTSLAIIVLLLVLLRFYRNKKKNELKFEALMKKLSEVSSGQKVSVIDTKDDDLDEKTANEISQDVSEQIIDGLKKLESQEYFLSHDCNSYNVAKKIKTNTSYLSKVVNTHYQKNFNTYINDLRINYVLKRLKDDVLFRSYSIQSIAEEVGYKSSDSFTKYFKKHTGLNPSFYIKEIKNLT